MTNLYEAPASDDSQRDATHANEASHQPSRGFWYLLLLPTSLVYTLAAREIAGPGYTTAPNQGAMVVFGLAAVAWIFVSIAVLGAIGIAFKIRGFVSTVVGIVSWIISCTVPFWIGMK